MQQPRGTKSPGAGFRGIPGIWKTSAQMFSPVPPFRDDKNRDSGLLAGLRFVPERQDIALHGRFDSPADPVSFHLQHAENSDESGA